VRDSLRQQNITHELFTAKLFYRVTQKVSLLLLLSF